MKKLVMCLVVGAVFSFGIACAADAPNAVQGIGNAAVGAATTTYGAGQTCLEAVGFTATTPLQVAKDAINSVCRGLSGGDTLFWD